MSKKVFEREKLPGGSIDSGDSGSFPVAGKWKKLNSFFLEMPETRTLIRCPPPA